MHSQLLKCASGIQLLGTVTISSPAEVLLVVGEPVCTIIRNTACQVLFLITFMCSHVEGTHIGRLRVSHVAVVVLWLQAQGEAVASMGVFGRAQETGQAQSHLKECVKH